MEQEQKQMTEEEMKAQFEARKKEWTDFIEKLKSNPDEPVTKGELAFAIEVMIENIQGIGEMSSVAIHNTQALAHNFEQFMSAIGAKPVVNPASRTKGGIILPH